MGLLPDQNFQFKLFTKFEEGLGNLNLHFFFAAGGQLDAENKAELLLLKDHLVLVNKDGEIGFAQLRWECVTGSQRISTPSPLSVTSGGSSSSQPGFSEVALTRMFPGGAGSKWVSSTTLSSSSFSRVMPSISYSPAGKRRKNFPGGNSSNVGSALSKKISVSPWNDIRKVVAEAGRDYVLSVKPSPAIFAEHRWNPQKAAEEIRRVLELAAGECHIEFIMKDISTVSYQPQRLWEWESVVMETIRNHHG